MYLYVFQNFCGAGAVRSDFFKNWQPVLVRASLAGGTFAITVYQYFLNRIIIWKKDSKIDQIHGHNFRH